MITEILSSALLMIIMIDPSDKILLVSLLREDFHIEDIKQLIVRANLIGFFLLIPVSYTHLTLPTIYSV